MGLPSKNFAYFIKIQTCIWTWTSKSEDPMPIKTKFCVCDKRNNATMFSTVMPDMFCFDLILQYGPPILRKLRFGLCVKMPTDLFTESRTWNLSLRDPQVWSYALPLPCREKEAVCQLDILENGSWKKEICNSRQTKKSKNKWNINNRSSCVS